LAHGVAKPLTPGAHGEVDMVADASVEAEADQALYDTLKTRGGYGLSREIVAIAIVRFIDALFHKGAEGVNHTEGRRMIFAARDRLVARGEIEANDEGIWRLVGKDSESQE
jgi:hypothetical protein